MKCNELCGEAIRAGGGWGEATKGGERRRMCDGVMGRECDGRVATLIERVTGTQHYQ